MEAANVFGYCDGLPGLAHETKYLKNDTLTFSGNMVINQTEKNFDSGNAGYKENYNTKEREMD